MGLSGRALDGGALRRALMTAVAGVLLLVAASCSQPPATGSAGSATALPSAPASIGGPSGSVTPAGVWSIAALGDSVTSGGPCGCTPFPQLYGQDLAEARGVRTVTSNLGQGGLTSEQLLHELQDPGSAEAAAVREADIDLVTIGANDFADQHDNVTTGRCMTSASMACISDDLGSMRADVTAIIGLIHRLRGQRPTAVLVTGYWNVFEDGAVARSQFPHIGLQATRALTRLANDGIRAAAHQAGATYVDLYAPFNGPTTAGDPTGLLGPDGDHPNAAGQALIGKRLLAAGLPGLVEG